MLLYDDMFIVININKITKQLVFNIPSKLQFITLNLFIDIINIYNS
jgi:hypothetical protein